MGKENPMKTSLVPSQPVLNTAVGGSHLCINHMAWQEQETMKKVKKARGIELQN